MRLLGAVFCIGLVLNATDQLSAQKYVPSLKGIYHVGDLSAFNCRLTLWSHRVAKRRLSELSEGMSLAVK